MNGKQTTMFEFLEQKEGGIPGTMPYEGQPAQNTDNFILSVHQRAEFERLLAGLEGCGCADCQTYYNTIDLTKFGARVKEYPGATVILTGRPGADKWDQYHLEEKWEGQAFINHGKRYGLDDLGNTLKEIKQ